MLAQTAADVGDALGQARWRGGPRQPSSTACACRCTATATQVSIFTRTSDDVTARLPEVVAAVRALPVRHAGRRRRGDRAAPGRPPAAVPGDRVALRAPRRRRRPARCRWRAFFFDLLHLDGDDLLDAPAPERLAALDAIVPPDACGSPGCVTGDLAAAEAFLRATLAAGHEGVVAKSLGRAVRGRPPRRAAG